MLIGLLMLLTPCVVFVLTLPISRRLKPSLRRVYRIGGALVVFLGGATSLYLASYTGDQGGIAAYFFQIAVILVYVALSLSLVILNWVFRTRDTRNAVS